MFNVVCMIFSIGVTVAWLFGLCVSPVVSFPPLLPPLEDRAKAKSRNKFESLRAKKRALLGRTPFE